MKNLSTKDIQILKDLKEHPQGLYLWQIQQFADISRKEYTLYYIKKLIKKRHARKVGHLYFIQGDIPIVQVTKPYHQKKQQRPHAFQAASQLYRTSLDRTRETLTAKSIPYKELLKGNVVEFTWKAHKLRITSRGKLISHPELPEMPLNLPLEAIKARAAIEAGVITEAFLSDTGLRCIRNIYGELAIDIRYWENGYPQNEIAEETLRNKARIVYAYDMETGQARAWADGSPDPFKELETNSGIIDGEVKAMLQAIQNEEIRPYADEVRTRREIAGLLEIAKENESFKTKHHALLDEIRADLAELRQAGGFRRAGKRKPNPLAGQRRLE